MVFVAIMVGHGKVEIVIINERRRTMTVPPFSDGKDQRMIGKKKDMQEQATASRIRTPPCRSSYYEFEF